MHGNNNNNNNVKLCVFIVVVVCGNDVDAEAVIMKQQQQQSSKMSSNATSPRLALPRPLAPKSMLTLSIFPARPESCACCCCCCCSRCCCCRFCFFCILIMHVLLVWRHQHIVWILSTNTTATVSLLQPVFLFSTFDFSLLPASSPCTAHSPSSAAAGNCVNMKCER